MTSEEARKLQQRARAVAALRGHTELAEDFAQEAVLAHIRWPSQTLDQTWIDFVKKQLGNTRTLKGQARKMGDAHAIRLDAPIEQGDSASSLNHERIKAPMQDPGLPIDEERSSQLFGGREVIIYDLVFREEWTHQEVADFLGMEVNSVHWTALRMKQRIQAEGVRELLTERLEANPELLKTEVDWIKW